MLPALDSKFLPTALATEGRKAHSKILLYQFQIHLSHQITSKKLARLWDRVGQWDTHRDVIEGQHRLWDRVGQWDTNHDVIGGQHSVGDRVGQCGTMGHSP